jgi:hypothetical protein
MFLDRVTFFIETIKSITAFIGCLLQEIFRTPYFKKKGQLLLNLTLPTP